MPVLAKARTEYAWAYAKDPMASSHQVCSALAVALRRELAEGVKRHPTRLRWPIVDQTTRGRNTSRPRGEILPCPDRWRAPPVPRADLRTEHFVRPPPQRK